MSTPRRVLITGVSRLWGAMLAERLEADAGVEEIIAVDTSGPARELARTEFVRADLRHRLVGKLIRSLGIDTVVHAGTILDTRHASRRLVHETNVIGTMNLLAACGGADSPVRTVVVKSSTAIYGSAPDAPSFWTETTRHRGARGPFATDLAEMEEYVGDFSTRNPAITVTTLRFADVLGASAETPFAGYLGGAVVPTILGFDPRLQFAHEDDVVGALERAVTVPTAGAFNVAGDGIVILSQAIRMVGHLNVPMLPFAGTSLAASLLHRAGMLELPDHMLPMIQHGRVVDTTRLREVFGFTPSHRTLDCVSEFARWQRSGHLRDDGYHYEGDVEALLRAKAAAATRP